MSDFFYIFAKKITKIHKKSDNFFAIRLKMCNFAKNYFFKMKQILIAREKECERLKACMESDQSEFVVVCGRRRVGKTYLVECFFNRTYDFSYVGGHNLSSKLQLRNFAKALKKYANMSKQPVFENWFDAFDALEEYIETIDEDRKTTIFIDEMPWIDTQKSDFVAALENFWNGWANRRTDILFVASGSATSWMADNIEENQGGLHARTTAKLFLKPFNLNETAEFLRIKGFCWDHYQILQCYMLTGGVPYYLKMLDKKLSCGQNTDILCFRETGDLRNEFAELYSALFKNADKYIEIARLLFNKEQGLTKQEINKEVNLNAETIGKYLRNLKLCNFISEGARYGSKVPVYRLVDFYSIFYFKFMEGQAILDENWWIHNMSSPAVLSWMGHTFEIICLQHYRQILKALGISGMANSVATWLYKGDENNSGAQVDMTIDRADRMIHLCEMKFCQDKFRITDDYVARLRQRRQTFIDAKKPKKAVVHTFVTTFGLANPYYSSFVHSEVTMDDLFLPL